MESESFKNNIDKKRVVDLTKLENMTLKDFVSLQPEITALHDLIDNDETVADSLSGMMTEFIKKRWNGEYIKSLHTKSVTDEEHNKEIDQIETNKKKWRANNFHLAFQPKNPPEFEDYYGRVAADDFIGLSLDKRKIAHLAVRMLWNMKDASLADDDKYLENYKKENDRFNIRNELIEVVERLVREKGYLWVPLVR